MTKSSDPYDVIIAGQGAAAFSAALYAARYQMRAVVIGDTFGGETAIGGEIENYPGFESIDGFELMTNMKRQVEKYGVPIIDGRVEGISRDHECFEAATTQGVYQGTTVILAVGRERRKLGLPREEEWTGRGVSYCATCDAPLYRGKVAAVVGGGSAAVEGAVLLGKYTTKTYIIYRGQAFTRPEPVSVRLLEESPTVETLLETNVTELVGDDGLGLKSIVLDRPYGGSNELTLDGLFVEIGADPRVELPRQLGVELTEDDEVAVDKLMRTNVPGLFAAGDLTNASGHLKQTITAAAQGAIAATSAYDYASEHFNACELHAIGYEVA